MKGVVFLGDRKLELRGFPDPTPGPRDVILEVKASGMCGSDLHNYRAPARPGGAVTGGITRQAGVIAGHEPCGIVAAVGAGVTEKEARVGQRVMDHHYEGCGNCKHCRAGWTQMCLEGTVVYGSGGHGGHARYMKVLHPPVEARAGGGGLPALRHADHGQGRHPAVLREAGEAGASLRAPARPGEIAGPSRLR
jgi:threonine dehydrogenase-like Zn-dependent dehydrogenase